MTIDRTHTVLIPEHSNSKRYRHFEVDAPNPEVALYLVAGNEYSGRLQGLDDWITAIVIDHKGHKTKWRRSYVWALQEKHEAW